MRGRPWKSVLLIRHEHNLTIGDALQMPTVRALAIALRGLHELLASPSQTSPSHHARNCEDYGAIKHEIPANMALYSKWQMDTRCPADGSFMRLV